jgi:hypothetical protein
VIKPSAEYQHHDSANPVANQSPKAETNLEDPTSTPIKRSNPAKLHPESQTRCKDVLFERNFIPKRRELFEISQSGTTGELCRGGQEELRKRLQRR